MEEKIDVGFEEVKHLEKIQKGELKNSDYFLVDDSTLDTRAITYENLVISLFRKIARVIEKEGNFVEANKGKVIEDDKKLKEVELYKVLIDKIYSDILNSIPKTPYEDKDLPPGGSLVPNEYYKPALDKIYSDILSLIKTDNTRNQAYKDAINKIYRDLRQTINDNVPRYSLPSYLTKEYLKGVPDNIQNKTLTPQVVELSDNNIKPYNFNITYENAVLLQPIEFRLTNKAHQNYSFIMKFRENDVGRVVYFNLKFVCTNNIGGYSGGIFLTFLDTSNYNTTSAGKQLYSVFSSSIYNATSSIVFNGWYRLGKIRNIHGREVPILLKT